MFEYNYLLIHQATIYQSSTYFRKKGKNNIQNNRGFGRHNKQKQKPSSKRFSRTTNLFYLWQNWLRIGMSFRTHWCLDGWYYHPFYIHYSSWLWQGLMIASSIVWLQLSSSLYSILWFSMFQKEFCGHQLSLYYRIQLTSR